MDDLTLAEANEVGRIMARDGISTEAAIDRYFGADTPSEAFELMLDVRMLPEGTRTLIERRYEKEIEERNS